MMLFPVWFFNTMVVVGIILAACGVLLLLGLLTKDMKGRSLW